MNTSEKEISCYTSAVLIRYALEHGQDPKDIFASIEDKREVLEIPHEWNETATWTSLAKNVEKAGTNIFTAGMVIFENKKNQLFPFQVLFLRVASIAMIMEKFKKIFEKDLPK